MEKRHLCDDQLLELAQSISSGSLLSDMQLRDLRHVAVCEECYKLMRCMAAMIELTDNVAAGLSAPEAEPYPEQPTDIRPVIRVVIVDTRAVLEQLNMHRCSWVFEKPLPSAAGRSAAARQSKLQKLEDWEDSRSFVSYNPATSVLSLQLVRTGTRPPKAWLKRPDGTNMELPLEQRENLFYAAIPCKPDDRFEIILER